MLKRSMNMFEFIFAVLFLLKITKTGIVADWSWVFVFLLFIINLLNKFFVWVWEGSQIGIEMKQSFADAYITRKKRRFVKKSIDELSNR